MFYRATPWPHHDLRAHAGPRNERPDSPVASCDHCGKSTQLASLRQVQRAAGCRLWVCISCEPYGSVDVAEQVRRDREAYAGGPKVLQSS